MRVTLVFLTLLFSFAFFSCTRGSKEKLKVVTHDTLMPEIVHDVDILYSDSGRKTARITAPLMERYGGEKPYVEMRNGVVAIFYDRNGNEESSMTARYGINYIKEKKFFVRNDVVVKNVKGEELNTEKLLWEQDKRRISSDVFVKITRENEILMGNGFESNEDFSVYRIYEITGNFNRKKIDK